MMTSRTTATQFPIFGIVLLGALVASLSPVTLIGQSVQPAGMSPGPGSISLDITDFPDPVVAGSGPGNLTYTVKATHSGTGTATGVMIGVTFTLPPGVSVDSITPGAGTFSPPGGDGTWTVDVPAGMAGVTLTAVLTVGPSTVAGFEVISITATDVDLLRIAPTTAPTESESTSVETNSDLEVTKTDGVTEATLGSTLIYTIVVTNLGPSDTTTDGVVFEDFFDSPLTDCFWTSVAADGASGNTAAENVDIEETLTLPVGASVTYTVVCTIDEGEGGGEIGDTVENVASVSATEGTDEDEGELDNNEATDTTEIVATTSDVGFSKFFLPDTIGPGSTTTLRFEIDNSDSDAEALVTDIAFTDFLPEGLVFADPPSAVTDCIDGSLSLSFMPDSISLTGARLPPQLQLQRGR